MRSKKGRRLAALLAALALFVAAMAGCSDTDLGFFKLIKEVSELESFTVSADIEVEYDENVLNSFYYYYYDDEEGSAIKVKLGIVGEVVYSPPLDTYLNLKVKYGINSNDMPHEANIRLFNGVYYMPVEDYVDLHVELLRLGDYSDKMCRAVKTAATKETGECDYVILGDDAYLYQWLSFTGLSMYMDEIIAEEKEITELLTNTIMRLFSGLSTGMTKAVPDGYAMEVTPEKAVDFYSSVFKYISQNKPAIRKGMVEFFESLPEAEEEIIDYFLDEIEYYTPSKWDSDYAKLLLRGSSLNAQVTKNGDRYTQDADLKLRFKDEPLLSFAGSSGIMAKDDINQEAPTLDNPISLEDIDTILERAERRINYVNTMTISWRSWYFYDVDDGFNWIGVDVDYLEGYAWHYMDCINDYGTLFVPLREVCGWLGIEVGWDAAEKKAFATKDGQRVDIEGQLYAGTMFVKIREFEKLGFYVAYEYDSEWEQHTVTLRRK